jgi:hypothetical protein
MYRTHHTNLDTVIHRLKSMFARLHGKLARGLPARSHNERTGVPAQTILEKGISESTPVKGLLRPSDLRLYGKAEGHQMKKRLFQYNRLRILSRARGRLIFNLVVAFGWHEGLCRKLLDLNVIYASCGNQ